MLKVSPKDLVKFQNGEISRAEMAAKIAAVNPAIEIAYAYLDSLPSRPTGAPKITITQEQFNQHFRIKGVAADGSAERRGRKPKI